MLHVPGSPFGKLFPYASRRRCALRVDTVKSGQVEATDAWDAVRIWRIGERWISAHVLDELLDRNHEDAMKPTELQCVASSQHCTVISAMLRWRTNG